MKPKILFAEDDPNLGKVVADYLNISGYQTNLYLNGKLALEAFFAESFDICLLDVMMPELDGFSVAKSIREKNTHIPILFITAKSMEEDRIEGFKTGADDYILKPFSIEELILRIEVFLRRSKNISTQIKDKNTSLGKYIFNYTNLSLSITSKTKVLTQKEADILQMFIDNLGNIVKREELLIKIWGNDDYFLGRSLDVFISKLRKYLKEDENIEIKNYHSIGFQLIIHD
ncbi:MAG: response regulator transcription factor [Raineya sp.]|jgi:DNA-binding response OmpR family regulator|nr:response regulator transcription factor [Raineya sp.]